MYKTKSELLRSSSTILPKIPYTRICIYLYILPSLTVKWERIPKCPPMETTVFVRCRANLLLAYYRCRVETCLLTHYGPFTHFRVIVKFL